MKNKEEIYMSANKILKLLYFLIIIISIAIVLFIGKQFNLFYILFNFINTLSPLFNGFVIAWLFNPLVKKLNNKKVPNILAATIIYLMCFVLVYLFFLLLMPLIIDQINDLIKTLPNIVNNFNLIINNFFNNISNSGLNVDSIKESTLLNISEFFNNMSKTLPNYALLTVSLFISFIKETFLGLLIGFYFLVDYDNFRRQFQKLIPSKRKTNLNLLLGDIGTEVRRTVNGTLLLAFIVFALNAIGFVAIGLKGSIILAILCGIVDLIPFIGPYIGIAVASIIGFTMSPIIGLSALIISGVVQVLENIWFRPVIMSKATDLNPVIILSGLLIFAHLFGLIGMILATPLLAIIKVVLTHNKKSLQKIVGYKNDW